MFLLFGSPRSSAWDYSAGVVRDFDALCAQFSLSNFVSDYVFVVMNMNKALKMFRKITTTQVITFPG